MEPEIKNTFAAKKALKDITVYYSHILVSFDVKQLFTSIPYDLAISSVEEAIDENADTLHE